VIRTQGHERGGARSANISGEVLVDFDGRYRRRCVMETECGLQFLLDLERATHLRGGDVLILEDGRRIAIVAAAEPLARVRAENAEQLARIAWHLGNRHLPTQLMAKGLRIRRDHVIENMVRGLGARVIEIEAPFDPEGGAYVSAPTGAAHAHDHSHHRHDHDHHGLGHDHGHAHHHHEHGESCDHDHAHHGHTHSHRHGS
jgi:urease accessory protein